MLDFLKIGPMGAELLNAEWQTDRLMDMKVKVAIGNNAKVPKNSSFKRI